MTAAVSLLNYGVGNLGSVRNMFKRIGVEIEDVTSPEQLAYANRVLLPGVGAFDHGMNALAAGGWIDALKEYALRGNPLLGICLGMQLLLDSSEEGELPGLGMVPGRVRRFDTSVGLPVPHMGWNYATSAQTSKLLGDLDADSRFYFVHSYYAVPDEERHSLATTKYSIEFTSAVVRDNVFGTQFHPEKSHRYGMQLLENFSKL